MGRELTPAEFEQLLGAYALDALDADERDEMDTWLARTPDRRHELDELHETASLLTHSHADVPPDLWSRIEAQLGQPPPPLRLVPAGDSEVRSASRARGRTGPSRRSWIAAVAAAGAVAVAVAVGVVTTAQNSDQDARLDHMAAGLERGGMHQAATAAAMEPGSRVAQLATADGVVKARVVTTVDGRGYFMDNRLRALPSGRTYQLWALMSDAAKPTMISVGVLGRDPNVSAFTTDTGVTGFRVTEEDAPGVAITAQPMMIEGRLS